jgi:FKBP-type peptidyl-prolyl cis-trans isomerase SlyD
MKITRDCAVSLHFVLRDAQGEILSASSDETPLSYLHGHGQLLAALERELEDKTAGEALQVRLSPEQAYGMYEESNRELLPRADFSDDELKVGNRLYIMGGQGPRLATVLGFDEEKVIFDTNHELAGKSLEFDIRILSVRKATMFELGCGHVHE